MRSINSARASTRFATVIATLLVVTLVASYVIPRAVAANALPCPWVGIAIVRPAASSHTIEVKYGKATIFVEPITATSDIDDVKMVRDGDDTDLLFKFNRTANKKLVDATNHHAGRRLAFVLGREVLLNIAIPGDNGFDGTGAHVSLRHGLKQAQEVVNAVQSCARTNSTVRSP